MLPLRAAGEFGLVFNFKHNDRIEFDGKIGGGAFVRPAKRIRVAVR
jgi:hypothetical protein